MYELPSDDPVLMAAIRSLESELRDMNDTLRQIEFQTAPLDQIARTLDDILLELRTR